MSYPVLTVPAGDVIPIMFGTYNSVGASVTMSGLAVTDIEIYKDGSVTQRASDAGYTLLDTDGIDFDGITGIHGFSIDTGDNTDAGFYAVGSWFTVVVSAITVDGQTVSFIAAMFRLVPAEASAGVPDVNVASIDAGAITAAAIATGAIDADALAADAVTEINNGLISVFTDQAFLILESSYGPLINISVGTTGNDTTHVHLGIDASFGDDEIIDHLIVIRDSSESDSHARWITNYVGATSLATLDSALPFTPTSVGDKYTVFSIRRPHTAAVEAIETDTQDILSRLPAALVGGRIDAHIGSIADGVLTAAKFAAGAFDAVWSVATRLLTAGTNIVLSKGTGVTGFNDLDAAGVRSAVGLAAADLDTQLAALPTAAENADAVLDEALSGHVVAGSLGKAVADIEADTNELQTDDYPTTLAAILADTNELQTDWANGGRLDLLIDAILADTGTDGVAISAATANQIADAILTRDWTAVSGEAARSALNALRLLRNKRTVAGLTLTVTEEDDTTTAWTATVTTAAGDPATGVDPS